MERERLFAGKDNTEFSNVNVKTKQNRKPVKQEEIENTNCGSCLSLCCCFGHTKRKWIKPPSGAVSNEYRVGEKVTSSVKFLNGKNVNILMGYGFSLFYRY